MTNNVSQSQARRVRIVASTLGGVLLVTLALYVSTLTPRSASAHGEKAPSTMPAHPSQTTTTGLPASGPGGPTETPLAGGVGGIADFMKALNDAYAKIGAEYPKVEPILRASCFDCHSSHTVYPWYYDLPIIKGLIDNDIKEAREHMDMDKGFPFDGHASQLENLQAVREEIVENEMPLFSYRLIHWGSRIDGARRDTLFTWIDSSVALLTKVYDDYNMPLPDAESKGKKKGEGSESSEHDHEDGD